MNTTDTNTAVACFVFGIYLIVFGLYSFLIRGRVYLSSSVLATLSGVLLGPRALHVLRVVPGEWASNNEGADGRSDVLWFCRIILGIQVLSAGVVLPSRYIARPYPRQSLLILLLPVLASAWLICSFLIWAIFSDISFLEALVLGSCLAPTDPVLASSVVKGAFAEKHVPPHIRDLLLCESAVNDGAATPFFLFPVFILTISRLPTAIATWTLNAVAYNVVFPVAVGVSLGLGLHKALQYSRPRGWMDKESTLVITVAFSLAIIGALRLLHSNELLACFCAGFALNWTGSLRDEELDMHFSEGIDNILDVAAFLTLGTILPWDVWISGTPPITIPRLLLLGFCILLLRRLPFIYFMKRFIPEIKSKKQMIFVGWFGPMGVGALYYALLAIDAIPESKAIQRYAWPLITWIAFCSILVHGATLPIAVLARSVDPSFHPKFIIVDNDQEVTSDPAPAPEEPSSSSPAGPSSPLMHQSSWFDYGTVTRSSGRKKLKPINRDELDDILRGSTGAESGTDTDGRITRGPSSSKTTVCIYDEGDMLCIQDAEGNTTTRKVVSKRRRSVDADSGDDSSRRRRASLLSRSPTSTRLLRGELVDPDPEQGRSPVFDRR